MTPSKVALKINNSVNKKRSDVEVSINHLCESISLTSENMAAARMRQALGDNSMTQMLTFPFFQSQLQNQDCTIDLIEK